MNFCTASAVGPHYKCIRCKLAGGTSVLGSGVLDCQAYHLDASVWASSGFLGADSLDQCCCCCYFGVQIFRCFSKLCEP